MPPMSCRRPTSTALVVIAIFVIFVNAEASSAAAGGECRRRWSSSILRGHTVSLRDNNDSVARRRQRQRPSPRFQYFGTAATTLVRKRFAFRGGGGANDDYDASEDDAMMTVSHVDDGDDVNDDDDLDRRKNDDEDDAHYDDVVDSRRGADPAIDRTKNDVSDVANRKDVDDDDERYSRQMYTLGARAHRLVRSATAVLDGPLGTDASETPSGLLYEIAKNLALSGVGRIVLVGGEEDDDDDENHVIDVGYFDGSLDDLGAAYRRAALAEVVGGDIAIDDDDDDGEGVAGAGFRVNGAFLLAEYVRRLNPGVRVDVVSRSALMNSLRGSKSGDARMRDGISMEDAEGEDDSNYDDERGEGDDIMMCDNLVVVCVDRSTSMQLDMNDACRGWGGGGRRSNAVPPRRIVPFISVETAGLYAKVFCDFGPNFVVVDEDGENPRSTLLQRVEEMTKNDDCTAREVGDGERLYLVNCLQGEHHDVSRGDIVEFHGNGGEDHAARVAFPKCRVMSVKSPTRFVVTEWDGASATNEASESKFSTNSNSSKMTSLMEGRARSFARIKLPKQLSFLSLREILKPKDEEGSIMTLASNLWDDETLFAASDLDKSFDLVRRRVVMSSMLGLNKFVQKYGRLPLRSSVEENDNKSTHKRTDVELFQSLVHKIMKNDGDSSTNMERKDSLVAQFVQTCRAKFTPVQALAGALGAQEVLKVATGLYNPIRQILLYDCDEVLQGSSEGVWETGADGPDSLAASGMSYILGEATSNKLARSRLFLVGAGAIGCELLKNLAAMGAGTGVGSTRRGSIIITDMDTIEKSNLSRQLLFRDHDVGEFKSVAARAAVMRFSPNACVEVHTSRVGRVDEGPFDDEFWSSGCNVVLNALDNVEARLFVDSQCVTHGLGLIDAGTLGPKGNVQVVIPKLSESYGSSVDPPEPDIPVCTLKNFPYEISHTIQWARDLFDGYFNRRPRQANDYVSEIAQIEDLHAFGQSMIVKLGDDAAIAMAEELREDLGPLPFVVGADVEDTDYVLAVNKHSLDWAIHQAYMLFYVTMTELIQKHPLDSVDDDGVPFWSGARHAPKPMRFIPLDSEEDEVSAQQVIVNERIAQFVSAAARLRMESFLDVHNNKSVTLITLEDALSALQEKAKLHEKKQKKSNAFLHNLSGGGKDSDTLSLILERLNEAKIGATFLPHLNLVDFEKDDESNGHVSFITAASNLRAMAYGIPPADAMETRRVAGRIVPAMITTTALVSALSCLELVKLLKGLSLAAHRNAFVNLALPFFAFTPPMPAEEVSGVDGRKHTIWSRLTCSGPSTMTLEQFLKKIILTADFPDSIEVSSVSYGPYMIFANFLHIQDQELLGTPLLDAVKDSVISEDYDEMTSLDEVKWGNQERTNHLSAEQRTMLTRIDQTRFVDFLVTVEDSETGEEFELPTVRFIKDKPQQDPRTSHVDD